MTRTDISHDQITVSALVGTWKTYTELHIFESYTFSSGGTLTFKRVLEVDAVETVITTETFTYSTQDDFLVLDSKILLEAFIAETDLEEEFLHIRWPYLLVDIKTVVLLKQ